MLSLKHPKQSATRFILDLSIVASSAEEFGLTVQLSLGLTKWTLHLPSTAVESSGKTKPCLTPTAGT